MQGIGARLVLVPRSRGVRLAFVYKPIWFEKSESGQVIDPSELCLIDWATKAGRETTSDYLKKRKIGYEESDSPELLHVFCYPSNGVRHVRSSLYHADKRFLRNLAQEELGWWYIGAMNWQQVIIPPAFPTLRRKASRTENGIQFSEKN
jgi:hypothetical protein